MSAGAYSQNGPYWGHFGGAFAHLFSAEEESKVCDFTVILAIRVDRRIGELRGDACED
jgi:hypothetical protein